MTFYVFFLYLWDFGFVTFYFLFCGTNFFTPFMFSLVFYKVFDVIASFVTLKTFCDILWHIILTKVKFCDFFVMPTKEFFYT